VRSNSQDVKSLSPEHRIADRITPRLLAVRVTLAIDLHDEPALETGEINSHLADRKLLAELQAGGALP
jgi:hypothetical protein